MRPKAESGGFLAALSVYALGYADVPQSNSSIGSEMTTQSLHASPILVTGAAGAVGSIGRNVTEMLLAKGHKVRALVRREDERRSMSASSGTLIRKGRMLSPAGAATTCDGSRLAAPAAAMPIVAVPKSRRRSWLIASLVMLVSVFVMA
jgi:nucleoside-diphosphate-sugar epimerase